MKRILITFIGCIIYAFTINELQVIDVGMGAFDSLTLQVMVIFNIIQFGNASFLIHFVFSILLIGLSQMMRVEVKFIFLSIASIFLLSRLVNLMVNFQIVVTYSLSTFIIIFLFLNFGLYLIAKTNIIIAPFDKFVVELAKYLKINLGVIRFVADVSLLLIVVLINLSLSSNSQIEISIFTLLITFGTGINLMIYELIIGKKIDKLIN